MLCRRLGQLGVIETNVLVLVQRVQRLHLSLAELKVEDLPVGDDSLLRVRFGQGNEAVVSALILAELYSVGARATHPRCKLHRINTCAQLLPVSSAILVSTGSFALEPCTRGE
jgi:hypothetical protein